MEFEISQESKAFHNHPRLKQILLIKSQILLRSQSAVKYLYKNKAIIMARSLLNAWIF